MKLLLMAGTYHGNMRSSYNHGQNRDSIVVTPVVGFVSERSSLAQIFFLVKSGISASVKSAPFRDLTSCKESEK